MSMKTGTGPICIISTLISLSFMLWGSAQGHPDPRILVIKKRKERKVKSLSRSCHEKHFVVFKCQSLIPQVGQCLPVTELNVSLGKKGLHLDAKEMISWVLFPPREEKIAPSVCTQLLTSQMLFSSVIFLSSLKIKAEDTAAGKVVEETQQTRTSIIIPILRMSTLRPRAHTCPWPHGAWPRTWAQCIRGPRLGWSQNVLSILLRAKPFYLFKRFCSDREMDHVPI